MMHWRRTYLGHPIIDKGCFYKDRAGKFHWGPVYYNHDRPYSYEEFLKFFNEMISSVGALGVQEYDLESLVYIGDTILIQTTEAYAKRIGGYVMALTISWQRPKPTRTFLTFELAKRGLYWK